MNRRTKHYKQTWFLATLCVVILAIITGMPIVHAKRIKNNSCSVFSAAVKKVYVNIEQSTPYKEVDWPAVLEMTTRQAIKILSEGEITVHTTQLSAQELEDLPEDTAYIKLVYSYIDKKNFTINPPDSQLASWAEIFRRAKDEKGNLQPILRQTQMTLIAAPKYYNPRINLISAQFGKLENIACDILRSSANKQCTNRESWSKNTVIPSEEKCVPTTISSDIIQYPETNKIHPFFLNEK